MIDKLTLTKPLIALNIQSIATNTTTVGNVIDRQGYQSAVLALLSGTITDGTYTPLLEESSDNSTYTAVADADLLPAGTGQEAAIALILTDDNVIEKIGYRGNKRYLRLSIVSAGTTTGGTIGAVAILGDPNLAPIA